MSTKEIVQRYFEELKQRGRWESFLADDMTFTSFTSPLKEVTGKAAYLESTKRFFSMVKSVEVRDLIIEGEAFGDRKSTRLNSSHLVISYAVFCLKKKKKKKS